MFNDRQFSLLFFILCHRCTFRSLGHGEVTKKKEVFFFYFWLCMMSVGSDPLNVVISTWCSEPFCFEGAANQKKLTFKGGGARSKVDEGPL